MIRQAIPADAEAIRAFLLPHIETSMFLLGNLEAHGIGNTDHPHGMHYFLRETGDGITGVFGATNGGYLTCQLPGLTRDEAQTYAYLVQGYTLRGMTGDARQVPMILDSLPVAAGAWQINEAEPLYRLDLADLPLAEAEICPADHADLEGLAIWFGDSAVETRTGCYAEGPNRARQALERGHLRLLLEGGVPVAMADINARAGDCVQLGGVYVPPALRGSGRAGRLVVAQLHEWRDRGIARAVLFAASAQAARAYERIGFRRFGDYHIAVLSAPLTLGSPR